MEKANAQPSTLAIQTSASATTSVAYLTAGTASSTYQIDNNGVFSASKVPNMQPVDSVVVNVQFSGSSTASTLLVIPQWSNNNIDWYGFNNSSSTPGGILVLASSTLQYQWTPQSGAATSSMAFPLPNISEQHERVIFGTSGANGALYTEWDLKMNPQTN